MSEIRVCFYLSLMYKTTPTKVIFHQVPMYQTQISMMVFKIMCLILVITETTSRLTKITVISPVLLHKPSISLGTVLFTPTIKMVIQILRYPRGMMAPMTRCPTVSNIGTLIRNLIIHGIDIPMIILEKIGGAQNLPDIGVDVLAAMAAVELGPPLLDIGVVTDDPGLIHIRLDVVLTTRTEATHQIVLDPDIGPPDQVQMAVTGLTVGPLRHLRSVQPSPPHRLRVPLLHSLISWYKLIR